MEELEKITCEECGEKISISEDGTNMVTDCQSFSCPHSDPDREEGDPKPLSFEEKEGLEIDPEWGILAQYIEENY